jgi:hypothetical protein
VPSADGGQTGCGDASPTDDAGGRTAQVHEATALAAQPHVLTKQAGVRRGLGRHHASSAGTAGPRLRLVRGHVATALWSITGDEVVLEMLLPA